MKAVGIKVLKNKLSEYLRLASRGETVLVTDRDTVVAEIVPSQERRLDDAILAEAAERLDARPGACAEAAATAKAGSEVGGARAGTQY